MTREEFRNEVSRYTFMPGCQIIPDVSLSEGNAYVNFSARVFNADDEEPSSGFTAPIQAKNVPLFYGDETHTIAKTYTVTKAFTSMSFGPVEHVTAEAIRHAIEAMIQRWMDHEFEEWLRYDGRRVYEPHPERFMPAFSPELQKAIEAKP